MTRKRPQRNTERPPFETRKVIESLLRTGRFGSQRALALEVGRRLGWHLSQQAVSYHLVAMGARRDAWGCWYLPLEDPGVDGQ